MGVANCGGGLGGGGAMAHEVVRKAALVRHRGVYCHKSDI